MQGVYCTSVVLSEMKMLPAATAKAGKAGTVYCYVYVCVNKPESGSGDTSCSMDHHVSGCEYFGSCCLYVLFR